MRSTTFLPSRFTRLALLCGPLAVALALAGCGGGDDDEKPAPSPAPQSYAQRCMLPAAPATAPELPAPTGPHCVGKSTLQLTDTGRPERRTETEGDMRELSLKVWHPTPVARNAQRAVYTDPSLLPLIRTFFSLPDNVALATPQALASDALPAGGVYPVVLFSPGFGGIVEAYSSLLEDLASHGYIVVGIDHPYISGPVRLAGGGLAETIWPADPDQALVFFQDAMSTLVEDQRQVLDWLQARNAAAGFPLAGHMDLTRPRIYGHSLGGAAAVWTARQDQRVGAAIDIDGNVFGDTAGAWTKPMLFITTEGLNPTIEAVRANATGDKPVFTVPGAQHLDFSDLKLVLGFYQPGLTPAALAELGLGTVDAQTALRLTREQVLAFFKAHP